MRFLRRFLVTFMIVVSLSGVKNSHALSSDMRAVLIGGAYGTVIGTGMGLIALPFTKSLRHMFMGSSVGLYLGLIVGVYFITHRDDPGNPLRSELREDPPELALSGYEKHRRLCGSLCEGFAEPVEVTFPVYRF